MRYCPEGLFPQAIEDGLQFLPGGRFFCRVGVRVRRSRILPQLPDPPELALVVQHVLPITDLAVIRILNVNPFARLARFAE